jgi:DNA polymerase I-like protein with 3'-5' exonuclease and polymerase domains
MITRDTKIQRIRALISIDNVEPTGKLSFYSEQDKLNRETDNLVKGSVVEYLGNITLDIIKNLLGKCKYVGIDTETTGLDPHKETVHGIGLSEGSEFGGNWYILVIGNELALIELLSYLNSRVIWVAHNFKFEYKFIYLCLGVKLDKYIDTMVASYLINPDGSHKLSHLAGVHLQRYPLDFAGLIEKYPKEGLTFKKVVEDRAKVILIEKQVCPKCRGTGKVLSKVKSHEVYNKKEWSLALESKCNPRNLYKLKNCENCNATGEITIQGDVIPAVDAVNLKQLGDYCCEDSYETVNLWKKFQLDSYLWETENSLVKVLAEMELNGVTVDVGRLSRLNSKEIQIEIELVLEEIYLILPLDYKKEGMDSLTSPKRLLTLLSILGVQLKNTKEETLEKNKHLHPFIGLLLQYRKLNKMVTCFVEPLLASTGVVHSDFNQCVAATGRLTCSKPNLQQIPSPDKSYLGKELRKCFIPYTLDNLILCADYSQFELRILAYLSNDLTLIQAFKEGKDIHTEVTKLLWGLAEYEESNPNHKALRRYTKTVNFGLVYGMGINKLMNMTGLDKHKAIELMETHKILFGSVWDYLESCYVSALTKGYTETILGRKRYYTFSNPYLQALKGVTDLDYKYIESKGVIEYSDSGKLRQAGNHPIQGSNADAVKVAMVKLYQKGIIPLIQVHDELVIEVTRDFSNTYDIVIDTMQGAISLGEVPVIVEAKVAPNWGEAK